MSQPMLPFASLPRTLQLLKRFGDLQRSGSATPFACRILSVWLLYFLIVAAPTLAAKRPPIVGIAHIAFKVSDMAKARAFYGDVLGYDEPFRLFQQDGTTMLT